GAPRALSTRCPFHRDRPRGRSNSGPRPPLGTTEREDRPDRTCSYTSNTCNACANGASGLLPASRRLDARIVNLIFLVPLAPPFCLCAAVFRLSSPSVNCVFRVEEDDGDAFAVWGARTLYAQETRLLSRELVHPCGHRAVPGVTRRALRDKDHGVAWR